MKNYLLSIGIGKYENEGCELLPLEEVPKNDCNRLAKVLRSDLYGFEYVQKPLFDKRASYDAIVSALNGLKKLEEDSQLIIHFSGHGELCADRNMSYWLTHEAVEPSKFNPYGNLKEQGWISAEEIVKNVNAAGSRHVLILADCCYAGHLRYNYRGMGGYLYPDYAKLAIRTKSREILSPCSVTLTSSPAGDESVSGFTKCIEDKLKKKSKFAVISPPMLYGELLSLHQNPQYGHLHGVNEPGGYFLFTSPERLVEIYNEPFERDDKVHQVFCSKIEQKLQPISSAIDRSRYLDGFVGRQWVFDEVSAWIRNPKSRLFWLTGEPGVGKSAVSAYLAEHNEVTSAHHFFLFDKAPTLDLSQVAKSLAYQLAQVLPDYANYIDQLDDQRLVKLDGQSLFDDLIITPLAQVVSDPNIPIVMLLDGLDEASSDGKNEIAEYLAKLIDTAPAWLKIMFTSRTREPEINRSLGKHLPWELDAIDSRNAKDLVLYLSKHLPKCTTQPKLLDAILNKSEGSFLYIKHLCDEWKHRDKLPDINQLPAGLPGIYEQFFRRQFPEIKAYEEQVLPILELIIGAFEPLSVQELADFSGTSERHIQKVKRRMGSLLRESKGKLEFCHKSLPDWLTSNPSSEFYISKTDAQTRLIEIGWNYWIATRAGIDSYFLKYLISHLITTGDFERSRNLLFCGEYLDVKVRRLGVFALLDDFDLYPQDSPELCELRKAIFYDVEFINRHPEFLFQSILFHFGDKGDYALKLSKFLLDWRQRHLLAHGGIINPVFSSAKRAAQLVYEQPLPNSYSSRLLWANASQIIYSREKEVCLLDTMSGKKVHDLYLGNFDGRESSYAHGKLYFQAPMSMDSLIVMDPVTGDERRYFRKHDPDDWRICVHVFSGWRDGHAFWVDQDLKNRWYVYIIDFHTQKWTEICCVEDRVGQVVDNDSYIAISYSNGMLEIVNKRTNVRVKIKAHDNFIWALQFAGNHLFSCSDDTTIKKWNPDSLEMVDAIRCSDGIMSLHICGDEMCAGCRDGSVYYWVGGELRFRQKIFSSGVISVRYVPEYRWIATFSVSDDKMVVLRIEDGVVAQGDQTQLFDGTISAMLFSKCGKYLVLGGGRCLVLFDIELNQVVRTTILSGYVACMTLADDAARIYVGIVGRYYYVIGIPELEILKKNVFPQGTLRRMAYDSSSNYLHLLFWEGAGLVNPRNNEFMDFYEFKEELRERIGYANMCVHEECVYLSSGDHVRKHKIGSIAAAKQIPHKRSCDRGVAKAISSTLLLADLRSPLVAINEDSGDEVETFPFFVSDLNYIAAQWRQSGCLTIGTNNDGTMLINIMDKKILSVVPERYDILLKHPTKPLWAVSFLDTFRIVSVEHV